MAGLGQAVTCGEEDGYTQTIIAAAATCFIFNQVPNKLVDDKMLEAMLAMFVLAQRPSVKYGKHLSSHHDALCFKVGDHNNYTVVEVVKYLKGESPYL